MGNPTVSLLWQIPVESIRRRATGAAHFAAAPVWSGGPFAHPWRDRRLLRGVLPADATNPEGVAFVVAVPSKLPARITAGTPMSC